MKSMILTVAALIAVSASAVTVEVQRDTQVGPVKAVNGVGQPPLPKYSLHSEQKPPMFHYLKEAGIPYSRLHDVGGWLGGGMYVDIPNLFPDFDADENDPKNYRFEFTDALLDNLDKHGGVEPFFRLGVTIENFVYYKGIRKFPRMCSQAPKDHAKWARICEHIVRHYTEGWANGLKLKITYWEIWNEPENNPIDELNPLYDKPFEDYIHLYGVAASHLKSKFPHLKIGGYASCGFYAGVGSDKIPAANSSPRMEYFVECAHKFLAAARDNKWPLDFFSYHSYSKPNEALRQVRFADELLNSYGFTADKCERINNEWLPKAEHHLLGSAEQASAIAAEMLGMQNGPCDVACIYDARCDVGVYSPLFNPLTFKPHKAYYAFVDFNELRKLGKAVKCSVSDEVLWASAAAADGKAAVMIANDSKNAVPLELKGIKARECRITDDQRTDKKTELPSELPPFSFLLVME